MDTQTANQTGQWCLRFLNGELKGRTISLHAGSNVLGSSTEAEVLLPSGDILPRHLVLNVGQITVTAQKISVGTAKLNGEDILSQRKHIVAGDVLSIGKLNFQLDREYAAIESGDAMFARAQSVPAVESEQVQVQLNKVIEKRNYWTGIAVAIFALAGITGLVIRDSMAKSQLKAFVVLADVEKALSGFPEVEVIAAPGGNISVKGYVESTLRKQALQQAIAPFGQQINMSVHAAEDMVEHARRYISDPGVAVTYAGKGQLVISGAAEGEQVSRKISSLREDLHPTVLVLDKIQYQPKRGNNRPEMNVEWSAWQSILPARMVSITEDENGLRHIQLANGTRYYEGSILKSGAEIKRIEADGLIVEGGNFDSQQTKQ
jgi:type III secretion system YscD/HrpQ family protein